MEKTQMHKETCYKCGYEGYDEDNTVSSRKGCPKCGAKKLFTVPEGTDPMTIIVPKHASIEAVKN